MKQQNLETGMEKDLKKDSLITKLYAKCSDLLDSYLERQAAKEQPGQLYPFILKARTFYLGLSANRRKSFSFLLSSGLFFLLATLLCFDFSWGYKLTTIWIAFTAFNQLSPIANFIHSVTNIIILFTMIFMPEVLKRMIANFSKNVILLICSIFLGWFVAPIYLVYRTALIFVEPPSSTTGPGQ